MKLFFLLLHFYKEVSCHGLLEIGDFENLKKLYVCRFAKQSYRSRENRKFLNNVVLIIPNKIIRSAYFP